MTADELTRDCKQGKYKPNDRGDYRAMFDALDHAIDAIADEDTRDEISDCYRHLIGECAGPGDITGLPEDEDGCELCTEIARIERARAYAAARSEGQA